MKLHLRCTLPLLLFTSLFIAHTTEAIEKKPVLTVYTYSSFASEWGPGPKVKAAFEQSCHCELKFVTLGDGVSILNRVRLEGKNSPADVVLGLDNNLLQAATHTGLFTPSNIDLSTLQLPEKWQNNTFIPYDYGYFAFIYNKNTLQHPPTSLAQLIDGPGKWTVIYQDPRTSTPGLGLLLWMQKVYAQQAPNAWKRLAQKTVTVTKGWSEAYSLFLKGEADLVLSYTSSPAYHLLEEKKEDYAAAYFSEGHYLQVEVAAQLKNSQQPVLAQKFIQFMVTPDFQNNIPTGNWMYPVIDIKLPPGFASLPLPDKVLQFTPAEIDQHRAIWVKAWQNAISQ